MNRDLLVKAVCRLQRHKDLIKSLWNQRKWCENMPWWENDPEGPNLLRPIGEFCSRNAEFMLPNGEHDISKYCDACKFNEPIVARVRQLRTKTGPLAAHVARLARLVNASEEP
jgi:hypothetical protein